MRLEKYRSSDTRLLSLISVLLLVMVVSFVIPGTALGQSNPTSIGQGVTGSFSSGTPIAPGIKPFGGQILTILKCYDNAGWTISLGPPRGGQFVYIPGSSKSYLFGPPSHPGQWLLGVAGSNHNCDIDPNPKSYVNRPGNLILFHGSTL